MDDDEFVRFLVKYGSDVDGCDDDGRTPLFGAVAVGREEIVSQLIESGADVSVKDGKGKTVLSVARLCGNAKIVDILRERSSDDTIINLEDESPLYQFLIKHKRCPKQTNYFCDECGRLLLEYEPHYHCLECDTFDLCPDCARKTTYKTGHLSTHKHQIMKAE